MRGKDLKPSDVELLSPTHCSWCRYSSMLSDQSPLIPLGLGAVAGNTTGYKPVVNLTEKEIGREKGGVGGTGGDRSPPQRTMTLAARSSLGYPFSASTPTRRPGEREVPQHSSAVCSVFCKHIVPRREATLVYHFTQDSGTERA